MNETVKPTASRLDPDTPAWMLDAAEHVLAGRRNLLCSAMFKHGEDEMDTALFSLRCRQLDAVLARAGELGLL